MKRRATIIVWSIAVTAACGGGGGASPTSPSTSTSTSTSTGSTGGSTGGSGSGGSGSSAVTWTWSGSAWRYIESGEVQYLFDIVNSCGVMHRFDHLLTLSSRFQALADTLPAPTASSATTVFPAGTTVTEGETIATAVGFRNSGNTSVDWGAYDLRQKNTASNDAAWLAAHPGEQAPYALCWLDNVAQSAQLRALPGGDGAAGKTSDYCR